MTTKEKILRALEGLPEDSTLNETILDAIDRLVLLYRLEQGIEQADAGQTISNDEAKKRIQRWRA